MKVQCVICDKIEDIDDYSVIAKKLRNRPIHTYMCEHCQERITKRTDERKATGNFSVPHRQKEESDWP
ncbi:YlaI family protein [Shouchella sp. 1P09AA]|uniref:YlaI family protein n=1 Tax=Bacillaceae TaxID=186817 RepID=UPI000C072BF1|nr:MULTISPECIES: YlaI family protein [Bacillaceae]UTR04890.1 YlaI family protein [Alkalihalobacillus sp. LMS6]